MRPLRFLLTLASCVAVSLLLIAILPWQSPDHLEEFNNQESLGNIFSWRMPASSLFPPSAIISLTDDNSTFFLARPAAFGPALPARSLSGQLWIGSGFGDDRLGRGSSSTAAEGELGCSDVPGWYDGDFLSRATHRKTSLDTKKKSTTAKTKTGGKNKRHVITDNDDEPAARIDRSSKGDGTDDHLHHPLPASGGVRSNGAPIRGAKKPGHADIQSLQESAEIAGKIVLLSRGGCGFLEKVKWVQRRGGIALIVGDDTRGGQLVTMYARGDTSNVTIPALFTSHTTAHLLSSLIPSERTAQDSVGSKNRAHGAEQAARKLAKGSMEAELAFQASVGKPSSSENAKSSETSQQEAVQDADDIEVQKGWFAKFFRIGTASSSKDSRRPPSSGIIDWVLPHKEDASSTSAKAVSTSKSLLDSFVIGVHDWRDPDLVVEQMERLQAADSTATDAVPQNTQPAKGILRGISSSSKKQSSDEIADDEETQSGASQQPQQRESSAGWLNRFFSHSDEEYNEADELEWDSSDSASASVSQFTEQTLQSTNLLTEPHDGLWVTLTPTTMSASPFLDTLLVLVVSPLVTLTVVYALLLLRSRIRRRRWRAPKSVVEQLPVRTYQAIPSSTSSSTSISSAVTAATPLLTSTPASTSRPTRTRAPRPRSRTTPAASASSSLQQQSNLPPTPEQIEEKRAAGLAEWRRRYGGKQRECVVCLEEYVDGVSQVMSLPCGHEFHAECITPWLTTRRRTCPICKGDVVRSLASASAAFPEHNSTYADSDDDDEGGEESYEDEDNTTRTTTAAPVLDADDVQEQAVMSVNDDPIAARPVIMVSRDEEAYEDLERGMGVGPDRNR